jgi:hypothetical protein
MCGDKRSVILGGLYLAYQPETFSLPSIYSVLVEARG